jgi:hypothetical protein
VGDEEDAFFRGLALQDKLPKYVELLKFRVSSVADPPQCIGLAAQQSRSFEESRPLSRLCLPPLPTGLLITSPLECLVCCRT